MSLQLGTKAETLERLALVLKKARILPQFRFTVSEWQGDPQFILKRMVNDGWLDRPVIVRSSALHEDGSLESLAGQFASVPHVQGESAVVQAITHVVNSYVSPQEGDQIFLQPQLTGLTVSGVAFGIDLITGGPYIVVNDQRSSDAGEVTSGIAVDDELFYWLKESRLPKEPHLAAVVQLMEELEELFETDALDVEFAWADETLYLLQLRPLARVHRSEWSAKECEVRVAQIECILTHRQSEFPQVLGTGIAWGAMTDWNPAEMIGLRPRPLAMALYRECLTDRVWSDQRRSYGYRDVTGVPLMACIGGQALIDIRASFTSFIPNEIPAPLAHKLVEMSLCELQRHPELHDKVELELLFHCWTFDLRERLLKLQSHGDFSPSECVILEQALRRLTLQLLSPNSGPAWQDRQRMQDFEAWLSGRPQREQAVTPAVLREILAKCRDQGASAFAGLARVAFIAVSLVNSLVNTGIWTDQDREQFFRSQQTVLSRLHHDRGRMTPAEFYSQYGHLRPGTYDILVQRYDETPEQYLSNDIDTPIEDVITFQMSDEQSRRLAARMTAEGLPFEPDHFVRMLSEAIEQREYGKFVYSRGISELLRMLGDYAATLGLSREDCSYADQSLWDESVPEDEFPAQLHRAIAAGRAADHAARGIALPPLLLSLDELRSFRLPRCQPNFVTRGVACGPVRELKPANAGGINLADLKGAVLMLPSADPGFDWIFSAGIVSFVTKFGGANSHMAIRAREWNLPAAIGVGEVRYRRLVQARSLRIDCLNQLLVTLP